MGTSIGVAVISNYDSFPLNPPLNMMGTTPLTSQALIFTSHSDLEDVALQNFAAELFVDLLSCMAVLM